ncbi:recombination regulator RecX [Herbidospora daliensis]|uniref:recombination regulator RecX n=1 Tax=Herbidospora daliensis TaxID=295585 RepID=UPI0034E2576B
MEDFARSSGQGDHGRWPTPVSDGDEPWPGVSHSHREEDQPPPLGQPSDDDEARSSGLPITSDGREPLGGSPGDEGLGGGSSEASSGADGRGKAGQALDGPDHADRFPGDDGGDGATGSSNRQAAADDRPNPLDWGGRPDEEPSGRGGRGRRSKTGRAGRRTSRRDDPFDGDPADGDGLFDSGSGFRDASDSRTSGNRASGNRSSSSRGSKSGGFGDGDSGGRSKRRNPFSAEQSSDPEARARGICLRLLTLAPRTRAQLAEALLKREIPAEVADRVLERFSEVGLIDDQAFAAMWVSSRHHGRGLARRALAQELRHRGVEEEMVKEAVEQLDPEEEVETARRLVARKLGSTRGADPRARTRKLVGMLARKGYPAGLAFRIVREALEAEGEEASGEDEGYLE